MSRYEFYHPKWKVFKRDGVWWVQDTRDRLRYSSATYIMALSFALLAGKTTQVKVRPVRFPPEIKSFHDAIMQALEATIEDPEDDSTEDEGN